MVVFVGAFHHETHICHMKIKLEVKKQNKTKKTEFQTMERDRN